MLVDEVVDVVGMVSGCVGGNWRWSVVGGGVVVVVDGFGCVFSGRCFYGVDWV